MKGPVDLSCLAKGRAGRPGAACKARLRPGNAGSAAAAWVRSSAALTLCAGMLSMLGGCAIEPWVKPYERERLADPIMNLARESLTAKHREHVREVREGSRGGNGVQGGGCGCN